VSSETALLFFTLVTAGTLPRYALERLGSEAERTIRRLVLDGVLQVLHEGRFVCGPHVAELFSTRRFPDERKRNADLSVAALQYGQELAGLPEAELALRLYFYGRQPVSPELSRWLVDTTAVAAHLGIGPDGPVRRLLGEGWAPIPVQTGVHEHWWQWLAPSTSRARTVPHAAGYKLYISPAVREVRTALETVAATLPTAHGVTGFKIGAGLPGICRPDKLIVYVAQLEDLHTFAQNLMRRLVGCPAHGVPFTAAVTDDGLLSWGADPPVMSADRSDVTSWRMWVVEHLAEHLVWARMAPLTTLEPWQVALERLRLSGIDTDTWVPASGMWPEALGAG
jgi:hypothetical protein